jgi:hypothetical protein
MDACLDRRLSIFCPIAKMCYWVDTFGQCFNEPGSSGTGTPVGKHVYHIELLKTAAVGHLGILASANRKRIFQQACWKGALCDKGLLPKNPRLFAAHHEKPTARLFHRIPYPFATGCRGTAHFTRYFLGGTYSPTPCVCHSVHSN